MKIVTIVGARPQFIKAAMVSRAIRDCNQKRETPIEELMLHTGQHYDANMSDIFFRSMGIPRPTWMLQCGNASHGEMTGRMLIEIEKILMDAMPDYVLVYGDTNSTLAGALAAAKLHIPVVHVEAGLRSFNRQMPEEINRVLTDHISTLLCCPTFAAVKHLADEGIREGVHHVGDVMYDAALAFGHLAEKSSDILSKLNLREREFRLCTVHRAENTDSAERMREIIDALCEMSSLSCPTVLPLHPRTRNCLEKPGLLQTLENNGAIHLIPPIGFCDMVMLEKHAATILTDSGGIQKEAYFHHTPCITLREETEWVETVDAGWNRIAGYRKADILRCLEEHPERKEITEYGTGNASKDIVDLL